MKKKIGLLTIKITSKYLLVRTPNYILVGIAWLNPWRVIVMANCNEEGLLGLSLLNFGLSFGLIVWADLIGIDLRFEILGKGFTYMKTRHPDILDLPSKEKFRIVK